MRVLCRHQPRELSARAAVVTIGVVATEISCVLGRVDRALERRPDRESAVVARRRGAV